PNVDPYAALFRSGVASRHAGPAMMDDVVGGRLANDPQESIPQFGARAEVAVRRQVLHERGRTGSGDVAGNRIDRLELSEVSGGFSRIEHEPIGIAAAPVDFV